MIPGNRVYSERRGRQSEIRLADRERETALLIAQGKSNHDIAEAMIVSEKTAETYVTRILAKPGFDSRVQIATWSMSMQVIFNSHSKLTIFNETVRIVHYIKWAP